MRTTLSFEVPDLKELYFKPHSEELRRWRQLGAVVKASRIAGMIGGTSVDTILEVGCGTGAVLFELAKNGIGSHLTGIDISDGAQERQNTIGSAELIMHSYDGVTIPYPDGHFDLVYATHVLEHVAHERAFLLELRRVARRCVYVEVPCELHMRTSQRLLQKTLRNSGHINAFTPESFALRLETSGLVIRKMDMFDPSFEMHRFDASLPHAVARWAARRALLKLSPRLASRVFTYHCGALCEKGATLNL